jgi:hypothetical protein
MSLPWRHRVLAATAFVTALATGYVANLDEREVLSPPTGSIDGAAASGLLVPPRAPTPGRAASLDRGDWPSPPAEALRAWGQDLPEPALRTATTGGTGPVGRPRVAAAPTPAASAAAAAVVATPPPAWRLIGRVDDDRGARALLATPQQLIVVAGGDTLDGRWRVERIDADAVELRALAGDAAVRLAWEAR